jgi:tight adherence protein C
MALSNRLLATHQEPPPPKTHLNLDLVWQKVRSRLVRRSFADERRQLADVSRVFGLLLENGLPVTVAFRWLTPRLSGQWHFQFDHLVRNLDLGADLIEELSELAMRLPIEEISELCQKLRVAIERGTPIAHQISNLADSIQQQVMRELIRRAGQNETKMLVPTIFLILPVTVLFAIFPSILVLQAGM